MMNTYKSKLFSVVLVILLAASALSAMVIGASANTVVNSDQAFYEAIENIPAGGSGEITVENAMIAFSHDLFIENKDIVFHLKNAQLQFPTIMFVDCNITINADAESSVSTVTDTTGYGSFRLENWTWDPDTGKYAQTFAFNVNGGKYFCADGDLGIALCPGITATFHDARVYGEMGVIDQSGVDILELAAVQINSGRYANDISAYVPEDKWCGEENGIFYVRDTEYTEEFSKILTDGKVVFDYVKPASKEDDMLWLLGEDFYARNPGFELLPDSFNADLTKCQIVMDSGELTEEIHTVDVFWNYDEAANAAAQEIIEKFPQDRDWFFVSDLELVNYWVNHDPDSEIDSLGNYSGELKSYMNHANFLFTIEVRGGADDPFYTERIGSAKLIRDGKVYYASGMLGARAEHAIYVPESTGDTSAELIAAAQKRIDDYIGAGKIQLSLNASTVTDYYDAQLAAFDQELADAQARLAAELAKPQNEQDYFVIMDCQSDITMIPQYKQYFIESFEEGGDLHFLGKAAGDYFFDVEVNGETYLFVIIKDDEKLQVPKYVTVDVDTNVQVNSTSSEVPLDTVIQVEKITEGEEYDRIVSILNADDNETFDIKLHSGSLDEYVTRLTNGQFEVTIPVPDRFKGKPLKVFYVGASNVPEEYDITFTDESEEYAVFVTDHFSIYTLTATHEHSFADVWDSDKDDHWHSCQCGETKDKAAHTFGEWKVTRQATVSNPGSKEKVCSVCSYKVTEQIEKLTAEEDKDQSPPTGDRAAVLFWSALAFACCALSGVAVLKKKYSA